MTTQTPAYVDIPGRSDASVIPPGVFTDTRAWSIAALGDRDRMQAFADSLFTTPSGGEWIATIPTSLAFFIFFNGGKLSSPSQPIGWTQNHEFTLSLPMLLRHRHNPLSLRFGLLPAWVYIDNYRGMVTGRESWGYFKNLGNVTAPTVWSEDFHCSLDTLVFEPVSSGTQGSLERLIEVNAVSGSSSEPTAVPGGPAQHHLHLLDLLKSHIEEDALDLFLTAVQDLTTLSLPAFNLKQFRDVADGTKACYQAITTSPLQVQSFSNLQMLNGDHTVTITDAGNAQIAGTLGFGTGPIPMQFGVGADVQYQAIAGETLWKA